MQFFRAMYFGLKIYNEVVSLSIFFNDKEYISASRAGEKIGYSSDYIGQLCRSGRASGKLVGRTWYVEYESLVYHKNAHKHGKLRKMNVQVRNDVAEAQRVSAQVAREEAGHFIPMRKVSLAYRKDEVMVLRPSNLPRVTARHGMGWVYARISYVVMSIILLIIVVGGSVLIYK